MKAIGYLMPTAILNLIIIIVITLGLPNIVPLHINIAGAVDLTGSKWFIPIISLIPLLLIVFYMIKNNNEKLSENKSMNKNIEDKIVPILVFFFLMISWIPIIMTLSNSESMNFVIFQFISIIMSFLFIYLGYFIGSTEPNKYLGFRTPWALKNEVNWRKTQKIGSYTILLAGFILLICTIINFINKDINYMIFGWVITIISIIVIPTIYSYYEYKKLKK